MKSILTALQRLEAVLGPVIAPLRTRSAAFLLTCLVVLVLWGRYGNVEWLRLIFPNWSGLDVVGIRPAFQVLGWPDWDEYLIAFVAGFAVAFLLPCLFVKGLFGARLTEFGLSIPAARRREALAWSGLFLAVGLALFYVASFDADIRARYPFAKSFGGWGDFLLYEFAYLLFFAALEMVFRGYILFGAERLLLESGAGKPLRRSAVQGWAILVSALPYVVWHLGKPTPEIIGALVWAYLAALSALRTRTILHLILIHWIWNVWLDAHILRATGAL